MPQIKTIIVLLYVALTVSNGKSLDDFAICLANSNSQCLYQILDSLSKNKINEIKKIQPNKSNLERYIENLYKEVAKTRYILMNDSININKESKVPLVSTNKSEEYIVCQKLNIPNKICLNENERRIIYEGLDMMFGEYSEDGCVDYCGVPDIKKPIIDSLQKVMEITIINAGGFTILTTPEIRWVDKVNDSTYKIMIRNKYDQYNHETVIFSGDSIKVE